MTEGSIVLTRLTQADGQLKNRPVLILRILPRFNDLLVCGFSTQLNQQVVGFDEIISASDADFALTGLTATSLIRLSFLALRPQSKVSGIIGAVSSERHERLLCRLSDYLTANLSSFSPRPPIIFSLTGTNCVSDVLYSKCFTRSRAVKRHA